MSRPTDFHKTSKGRPGCLSVVHTDDFASVASEFMAANAETMEDPIRQDWVRQNNQPAPPEF